MTTNHQLLFITILFNLISAGSIQELAKSPSQKIQCKVDFMGENNYYVESSDPENQWKIICVSMDTGKILHFENAALISKLPTVQFSDQDIINVAVFIYLSENVEEHSVKTILEHLIKQNNMRTLVQNPDVKVAMEYLKTYKQGTSECSFKTANSNQVSPSASFGSCDDEPTNKPSQSNTILGWCCDAFFDTLEWIAYHITRCILRI